MQRVLLAVATVACFVPACAGRAQWVVQDSHVTADLRGITYVGGGVAWASGSHGTVLHTENMGATWPLCATPPDGKDLDFRGVQAFDRSTAIVMSSGPGDTSRLYKTTDGCQTWTLILTNVETDGFWDALQFQSLQVGTLLGDPVGGTFYLTRTTDGGISWTRQRNGALQADPKQQGAFAASNSSMIESSGALTIVTGGKGGAFLFDERDVVACQSSPCPDAEMNLDGSKNKWDRFVLPLGAFTESSGAYSLAWRPGATPAHTANVYVAVGGDYKAPDVTAGTAAYVANGKWQPADTLPHGFRSAVAYYDKFKTWIAVGPNGTDVSIDDGQNWKPLKPAQGDAADADKSWNALSLPFVVGPKGRIGMLEDKAVTPPPKPPEAKEAKPADTKSTDTKKAKKKLWPF